MTLEDLQALGIGFVSLGEGIDLGTPAGRLQLHVLAVLAEFERSRIQEHVKAGGARGPRGGVCRPVEPVRLENLRTVKGLSVRTAARQLHVSRSTLQRWRALARQTPPRNTHRSRG